MQLSYNSYHIRSEVGTNFLDLELTARFPSGESATVKISIPETGDDKRPTDRQILAIPSYRQN